jgi:NitT/TauT family transport system substrate-binding protein
MAQPRPTAAPAAARTTPLKVGLASNGKTYLPVYVAVDRTVQAEGLQVELVTFNGGAALTQALAGGSVDVGVTGLNSLVNAINVGHPFKAFYTGVSLGDYQWFANPSIQTWTDLRGRSLGVTGPGSLIDLLSRVVLKQHGLEPERDVQIVTVGNPPTALQALQASRVDATVLTNPTAWRAEEAGFRRLGTLGTEMVDEWPQSVLVASEKLIADEPDTLRALLRAQVRAIRLIEQDRAVAAESLVNYVKFERADAVRTYDEVKERLNPRGVLPEKAMPFFWQVAILAGDAPDEWPESRYLDRRFIDSYDTWAPR